MLGFDTNKEIIGNLYDALFEEVKRSPAIGLFVELNLHDLQRENSKVLAKFQSKLLDYGVLGEQVETPIPKIAKTHETVVAQGPKIELTCFTLSETWGMPKSDAMKVKFVEWFIFKEKEKRADLLHGKIWESLPATIGAIAAAVSGAGFVLIGTWVGASGVFDDDEPQSNPEMPVIEHLDKFSTPMRGWECTSNYRCFSYPVGGFEHLDQ